jgi:hypothetical protein
MSGLAEKIYQTAFELEPREKALLGKPDLELVAREMRARVGRTLTATRTYKTLPQTLNPYDADSTSTSEAEAQRVNSRINDAVVGAFSLQHTPTLLSLEPLQEWEGYVWEIGDKTFTARLVDITAGGKYEDEIAEFLISDLSDTDTDLLKQGAVFRWVIGYQRQLTGNKRRVSQITFRRLPAWTKRDLIAAAQKASQISESIHWK